MLQTFKTRLRMISHGDPRDSRGTWRDGVFGFLARIQGKGLGTEGEGSQIDRDNVFNIMRIASLYFIRRRLKTIEIIKLDLLLCMFPFPSLGCRSLFSPSLADRWLLTR